MGEHQPKPKLSMFCALSINHQHFLLKSNINNLKQLILSDIKISVSQTVLEFLSKTCIVLTKKSKSAWPCLQIFFCHFWMFQTICFIILRLRHTNRYGVTHLIITNTTVLSFPCQNEPFWSASYGFFKKSRFQSSKDGNSVGEFFSDKKSKCRW